MIGVSFALWNKNYGLKVLVGWGPYQFCSHLQGRPPFMCFVSWTVLQGGQPFDFMNCSLQFELAENESHTECMPQWKRGAFKNIICWLHTASDSAASAYSTLSPYSLQAIASVKYWLNSKQARNCEQGTTCWLPSSWQISAAFLHSCSTRRTSPETPATCNNSVVFLSKFSLPLLTAWPVAIMHS